MAEQYGRMVQQGIGVSPMVDIPVYRSRDQMPSFGEWVSPLGDVIFKAEMWANIADSGAQLSEEWFKHETKLKKGIDTDENLAAYESAKADTAKMRHENAKLVAIQDRLMMSAKVLGAVEQDRVRGEEEYAHVMEMDARLVELFGSEDKSDDELKKQLEMYLYNYQGDTGWFNEPISGGAV